ncbi:hypothetical protein MSPP1_001996 [Malassezia sp. CBS 17886]|nr:hypothetical protein MSPP1_001996 [Malassezia sp. CBS 17886]
MRGAGAHALGTAALRAADAIPLERRGAEVRPFRVQPVQYDQGSAGTGHKFNASFIVFAVVAVAVFILIVVMVVGRMVLWQRRYGRLEPTERPALFAQGQRAADPIPPPEMMKKTTAPVSSADDARGGWSSVQPAAVTLDKTASSRVAALREQGHSASSRLPPAVSEAPLAASVQVTYLVSLPSPGTPFPEHLRRRNRSSADANTSRDFSVDLTRSESQGKRSASIRSRASIRDLSEVRRSAYLHTLENDAPVTAPPPAHVDGAAVDGTVVGRMSAAPGKNQVDCDDDQDSVGPMAFGTVVLPVQRAYAPLQDKGNASDPARALSTGDVFDMANLSEQCAQHVPVKG